MPIGVAVTSDQQLARLLQIGVVLEEVVEARASRHLETLDDTADAEIIALLEEAVEESHEHSEQLRTLIEELDGEAVGYAEIEKLVRERYARNEPEDFDDLLYDQFCNEETAYKFYEDLIAAIAASDVSFSIDRERLVHVLSNIRDDEAEGAEAVASLMEGYP